MDDLKLDTKNDDDLDLLSTSRRFSHDIGMQFGLEECTKVTF